MTKIEFSKGFPNILQPRVSAILNDLVWLLPSWMQLLEVQYDADNKENSCWVIENKTYRFGTLYICGHWASENDEHQIQQLIHELIHFYTSPTKSYFLDVLERITTDGIIKNLIKDELTTKIESCTEDLAFVIYQKFLGK